MKIHLSDSKVFNDNEIEFDRKITFVFGKNGTGKTTLTEIIKNMKFEYEVSAFQGFSNLIDENEQLNAVILGKENADINKKIKEKESIIEQKEAEIKTIMNGLINPNSDSMSNFWTRKEAAETEWKDMSNAIDTFLSKSAQRIKNEQNPSISHPTYNKNSFQADIVNAKLLSSDELKMYIATINTEIKQAHDIGFPNADLVSIQNETNSILNKYVIERTKIARIENNDEKMDFAKRGLSIHKKGDICAFCGSKIVDTVFDELETYFLADDVKSLQKDIQDEINKIDELVIQIKNIDIFTNEFYPEYESAALEIKNEIEDTSRIILNCLYSVKTSLDEKTKHLFEPSQSISLECTLSFNILSEKYKSLCEQNNNNNLSQKQEVARDRIRYHRVKELLDDYEYDSKKAMLDSYEKNKAIRCKEYADEENRVIGENGLQKQIEIIRNEINQLKSETKNEKILADNINKKLKHMVSFELVHVANDKTQGSYRVKDLTTERIREITKLSTGERNIIAFLYFIEKLNEIKENNNSKPRVIVFDDPMCSNDDGMQYLIIEELEKLMSSLSDNDRFILLTHNKHFYLNITYNRNYSKDRFIRLQSNGYKTNISIIENKNDDFKTSYESLWHELYFLFSNDAVSADMLLNPIRRIIETYTRFNAIDKRKFCNAVDGTMKLLNVNSHAIDDIEEEPNGKSKDEIIRMLSDLFESNNGMEHFDSHWGQLVQKGNVY